MPYPNPFIPSEGHENIIFEGLNENAKIYIYSLDGELVFETEDANIVYYGEGYRFIWDGKNKNGKALASGVYLYVIDNGNELDKGKIAIVR